MLVSYKTISRNIKIARIQSKLTQQEVAEKLGISIIHFGRIERGECFSSLEQLAQIANVLNISVWRLIDGSIDNQPAISYSDQIKHHLGVEFETILTGCSQKSYSFMIDLCKLIATYDKK